MLSFSKATVYRVLRWATVSGLLAIPACSYQYGIGIRCSEQLSNCEIFTGVDDKSKPAQTLE